MKAADMTDKGWYYLAEGACNAALAMFGGARGGLDVTKVTAEAVQAVVQSHASLETFFTQELGEDAGAPE